MNNDWVLGQTNTALPLVPPVKDTAVVGIIKLEKANKVAQPRGNVNLPNIPQMPTGPELLQKDDPIGLTKLKDYVAPDDLDPINRFMNWNKKHPYGQDAPMRSENKMVSFERKNNKIL